MEQRASLGRRRKVIRGGRRTEGRLSPLPSQPVPQYQAPAPGLDRRPQSGERAAAAGGGAAGGGSRPRSALGSSGRILPAQRAAARRPPAAGKQPGG